MVKDPKESNCNCISVKNIISVNEDIDLSSSGESVATLLWQTVGVKPNTPKVKDLESSGTPKCSELDKKAQNTSN
jgi:hypothetical protein